MANAWLDGHYTLTQIGEHFGCGRSSVNRAVKAFSLKYRPNPQYFVDLTPNILDLTPNIFAYKNRNQAMARAWLDGHYSLSQIGEHFGCGRSTVNRAVKAFRGKWET